MLPFGNNLTTICIWSIAEEEGFLIGRIMKAPEAYDPGGLTLMIDDFCVKAPELWNTVGKSLINKIKIIVKAKGAEQILIVAGAHDQAKVQFLRSIVLSIASEWYIGSI